MAKDEEDWLRLQTTKFKDLDWLFKPFNREAAPLTKPRDEEGNKNSTK